MSDILRPNFPNHRRIACMTRISARGHYLAIDDQQLIKISRDYNNLSVSQRMVLAKRLAACYNACDGIEDELVDKGLDGIGRYIGRMLRLNSARAAGGDLQASLSGSPIHLFADAMVGQFEGSGATNYLEVTFEHAELGKFFVTLQRQEGLTPVQKLEAAEAQRDNLQKEVNGHNGSLQRANDRWYAAGKDAQRFKAQRDELLFALQQILELDCPLTGNPTHAELVEHWEHEKSEGNGAAEYQLFALSAIAAAKEKS